MPSLRDLLPRRRENDEHNTLAQSRKSPRALHFHLPVRSPRSPRSPGSLIFPKSPKSPGSPNSPRDWSRVSKNYDGLHQCEGCNNVEIFISGNLERHKSGEAGDARPVILHESFRELNNCAKACEICRVFRQALILEAVTNKGVHELKIIEGRVVVGWREDISAIALGVYISGQPKVNPGIVQCNDRNTVSHLALPNTLLNATVIEQAKTWLGTCLNEHIGHCDNLSWSSEKPRFLVEIISQEVLRLCEERRGVYAALSYCWGDMKELSKIERDTIEHGKTLSSNLKRRRVAFNVSELPATVRDFILILHAMGIRFAWIDTLCIVQDKPDDVATMHKIYSNALFTLCSCATTQATESLIVEREAWSERTEPCRLGARWLTTADMSLNELRLRSPLAGRAWTLQEERLSPRMLYVSSSRLYWSCSQSQNMELVPTYEFERIPQHRPIYAMSDRNAQIPPAQDFLLACASRNQPVDAGLHSYWMDIVKSYALRDMGNPNDRLTALSGLAAKYLSANRSDEYLAGLWANDLAQGLAWQLPTALTREMPIDESSWSWPSWSWAALPLRTEINISPNNLGTTSFSFVAQETEHSTTQEEAEGAITRGERVRVIRVTSNMRRLWSTSSRRVDWSCVSRSVDDQERFTFAGAPEQDVHAVHNETGRLLVYENRKKEVVSQLDFISNVKNVESDAAEVWAFQLSKSTMILVEKITHGRWRRVGSAWDVRENFFASTTSMTLELE